MSDAVADVAGWAEELRALERVPVELGARVAPAIHDAAVATASAGTTPSGEAWEPTKDGGQALEGVAGDISVDAMASGVRLTLAGAGALHDQGLARGGVRRQVLPDDGEVPERFVDVVDKAFEEAVG